MRSLMFFMLCFLPFLAFSNQDSLEIRLSSMPDNEEKLEGLFDLGRNYNRQDYDKSDSIFKEFERIYFSLNEPKDYFGKYHSAKGVSQTKGENKEAGIESLKIAVTFFDERGDYSNLWDAYNNIGSAYDEMGNLAEALKYFLLSLSVAEDHLDEGAVAGTSINLGIVYAYQEMYDDALFYFKKSKDYYAQKGSSWGLGNNLNNIGQVYSLKQNSDSAIYYFKKGLDVWREIDDKKGIAMTVHNIGSLYSDIKEYETAEQYLKESLELSYEVNERYGITLNLAKLGALYKANGQREKALQMLMGSVEYAEKNNLLPLLRDQHWQLYSFYKDEGNYLHALEHYESFHTVYDSLNNSVAQKDLNEIQTKYETEKNQAEIERKRAELAEKDLTINASRSRELLMYLIVGVFIVVIIFVVMSLRQKNIANKLIAQQKKEVEFQKVLVEEKNDEITASIQYAKRIQAAILPQQKLVKQYLQNSFILYLPKDIVAGDFYWMENTEEGLLFAAADCTGHGVPGALVSVVCHNALNRSVREYGLRDPGRILDKAREIVVSEFEKSDEGVMDGMDISLCRLNYNEGVAVSVDFAGANNPMWVLRNGDIMELKGDKQPVGYFKLASPFTTHRFELQEGDMIYAFSDGYIDQFGGERGKKFKSKQLKFFLEKIGNESTDNQRELLFNRFQEWKGDLEQIDDVCVIGVRV